MNVRLTRTQRICQLVPSAGRRNELRAFAYEALQNEPDIDIAILAMMQEKKTSFLVAREVVMWIAKRYMKEEN